MRILERLQAQFEGYVWGHVLSMLMGLMLLKEAKTLSALRYRESLPTLSRTLNVYPWPLEQVATLRQQVVTQALQKQFLKRRGRRPIVYLILDDTVIAKRGLHLPQLRFHHSSTQDRVVRGWDLVFAALQVGKLRACKVICVNGYNREGKRPSNSMAKRFSARFQCIIGRVHRFDACWIAK